MHGPVLVCWLLVALCGTTGAFCVLRTRRTAGTDRQAAGVEAAMGLAMAVMAVPATALPGDPRTVMAAAGAAAGSVALRAAVLARAGVRHQTHHVVEGLAMVHMAVVMATAGGGAHAAHGGTGTTGWAAPVTGALLVYFAAYALRCAPRLVPAGAAGGPHAVVPGGGDEATAACRLALSLGMFAMLLAM
ncbi:DUF5134 domain-containing protein [Streptomyces sp. RFCAC02]|uniref:DUF5134 domain-containing protein n=1 Tax=Streptomyces sp. RFCAC02 TaxID=2499143 RepID=UPI0010216285|nr:DUF5134 domain-containing protein [Streptomyces sp. RFCAC02]